MFTTETQTAHAAQVSWAALPLKQRLRPVARLRQLLVERRDELTQAMLLDVNRPPAETLATDVLPSASACKYLLTDAQRILRDRHASRTPLWLLGSSDVLIRRPHGIVGVIGTWNYPLFLNLVPIVQALTAGNAVLWKPSEHTPKLSEIFTKLLYEAGFPDRLVQTLPVSREAGPALAESDIDFLHFTGSEAVGRKLATKLGERLIPSVLELSGVDACIVMPDTDIDLAARAVWYGLTLNQGQTCLAVRRIFAHADIAEALTDKLRKLAAHSGPKRLLLPGQVEQAQRLLAGAMPREVIAAPGEPGPGEFNPTIILNATPELGICREAIFAPLAALIVFRTVKELISLHNSCPFGLGCSIFSEGKFADGREYVPQLKVGVVVGDDVIVETAHPATPLTARGASGWGSTQGDEGLLAMTVPQTISARSGVFRPHIDAVLTPHPADGMLIEGMLRMTHARRLGERLRGLLQVIRSAFRIRKRLSTVDS